MTTQKQSTNVLEPSKVSRADRFTSFASADFGRPQGREEEWRFTPMRRIRPLFEADAYAGAPQIDVRGPENVIVATVSREELVDPVVLAPGDYLAALAWEKFEETTEVIIPREVELDDPVYITVAAGPELKAGRIVVKAEAMSKGTVVILHNGPALFDETVEIEAGEGAQLSIVAVHEWDRDGVHASSHRVRAARNATLQHMIVTLGGDTVRINVDTDFTGPGADIRLNGLYFVDRGQHLEHRVFVYHSQPDCYSRVAYKGALQGKDARSVWIGDCLIGVDADNTDTYELNRNLILTEGAKADSVPNLEIENGEIEGAGHASATGRFDDEQLFYLMSRGVPALEARRLVIRGFFAEILNSVGIPELQDRLIGQIEQELKDYDYAPDQSADSK